MAKWIIHSRAEFTAHHALTLYRGSPEETHVHRWQVAIRVGADRLNAEGFSLDFHEVHDALDREVVPLRDSDLNRHPEIGSPTPSAERVAEVIAGRLEPVIADLGGRLLTVSVWEGSENRVDLSLE